MRHYFLGLAADLGAKGIWRHTFAIGTEADRKKLRAYLSRHYGGRAILTKNGRSGLAMALRAYFQPGDAVLVNGFTCYAVYEALEAAGVRPAWADISPRDLNFTVETLRAAYRRVPGVKGVIIQNTLGNPVEIRKIEKFAARHNLVIIEDLAHSVGTRYVDGREAGTVGAAAVLSFGKDKVVDCCSGGAVVFREEVVGELRDGKGELSGENGDDDRGGNGGGSRGESSGRGAEIVEPNRAPLPSDVLRARFYPLFGAITRGLSYVHLSGVWMRFLLRIHWVERSADNRLDLSRKIAKFEAKLALERLRRLKGHSRRPLRQFYLVQRRDEALKELQENGYYFSGFWYEKPVSPKRYYDEVEFPEEECPVATEVAKMIVNFPNYYNAQELRLAREIIENYEVKTRLTARGVIEQMKEVAVEEARQGGRFLVRKLSNKLANWVADGLVEASINRQEAKQGRRKTKKGMETDRETNARRETDIDEGLDVLDRKMQKMDEIADAVERNLEEDGK